MECRIGRWTGMRWRGWGPGEEPFPLAVHHDDLADGHFTERGGVRGESDAAEPVQAGSAGCLAGAGWAGGVVVEGKGGHGLQAAGDSAGA